VKLKKSIRESIVPESTMATAMSDCGEKLKCCDVVENK
jgi:hypothetical protein